MSAGRIYRVMGVVSIGLSPVWPQVSDTRDWPILPGLVIFAPIEGATFTPPTSHQPLHTSRFTRAASHQPNESALEPHSDGFGAIVRVQLAQDVLHVDLDRPFGASDLRGDLGVGPSAGHQLKHLH